MQANKECHERMGITNNVYRICILSRWIWQERWRTRFPSSLPWLGVRWQIPFPSSVGQRWKSLLCWQLTGHSAVILTDCWTRSGRPHVCLCLSVCVCVCVCVQPSHVTPQWSLFSGADPQLAARCAPPTHTTHIHRPHLLPYAPHTPIPPFLLNWIIPVDSSHTRQKSNKSLH